MAVASFAQLTEVRRDVQTAVDQIDSLRGQESLRQAAHEEARTAEERVEAVRKDIRGLSTRVEVLELLGEVPGLTVEDVQDAIGSGRVSIPATTIQVPMFCNAEPAVWQWFGLSC